MTCLNRPSASGDYAVISRRRQRCTPRPGPGAECGRSRSWQAAVRRGPLAMARVGGEPRAAQLRPSHRPARPPQLGRRHTPCDAGWSAPRHGYQERRVLSAMSLQQRCLRGAHLPRANLHAADLTSADPTGASLTGAGLREADPQSRGGPSSCGEGRTAHESLRNPDPGHLYTGPSDYAVIT
ncbi:pentapeptide repeat-containing protein [Streptomyces sp. NPDC005811]|uniref:pentapeptide repeat-containing protein n=1 Tax=Streptomyces sp. NPDC005811 TaxID=3154565 RepID=UPI0033CF99D7